MHEVAATHERAFSPKADLPTIGMLWIGEALSYLEILCIKSFLAHGHKVCLYVYNDVKGVPAGVEVCDASTILAGDRIMVHRNSGSPAVHSDAFRYRLLAQGDLIWADTDAFCLKPFHAAEGYAFGYLEDRLGIGVLAIPSTSPALQALIDFTDGRAKHVGFDRNLRKMAVDPRFTSLAPEDMPWAATGPMAATYFLQRSGEITHAAPEHVYYPIDFEERNKLIRPRRREYVKSKIRSDTVSIHFYGRRMRRRLIKEENGVPRSGSYFSGLLERFQIDPNDWPVT